MKTNKDNSWPTPKTNCPKCGIMFDRAEDPETGLRPGPGDVTVCINCATVLHFKIDMSVAELPSLDLLDDIHRARVEKVRSVILSMPKKYR